MGDIPGVTLDVNLVFLVRYLTAGCHHVDRRTVGVGGISLWERYQDLAHEQPHPFQQFS